jgi:two-component system chemotaxis response regulator CheY
MGKKILVVDDFKNSLAVLKMTLEMKKYEVAIATNGQEALTMLKAQQFDLLVTDFNMPVMNGLDLVKKLKSDTSFSRFPIIVVSTEIDESKKREAFKAGVTFWLKKPFNAEMFIKAVEKVLG